MNCSNHVRRLAGRLRPRLLSIRSKGPPPGDQGKSPPAPDQSQGPPLPGLNRDPPTAEQIKGNHSNDSNLHLQLLGFEVDPISAGQLTDSKQERQQRRSGKRRQITEDDQVEVHEPTAVEQLAAAATHTNYSHIINGYIGSRRLLIKLALLVRQLKRDNPALQFVCDPVMGDHGPGLYVPADLVPIYRDLILPLADVVVPNQFEAELLTGRPIHTEVDALRVMELLHDRGVGTVILSSTALVIPGQEAPHLVGLASQRLPPPPDSIDSEESNQPPATVVRMIMPRLEGSFVGAGDLFTALSTAWLFNTGGDLRLAMEKSASSVQAILRRTLQQAQNSQDQMEQDKADKENPQVSVVAEVVELSAKQLEERKYERQLQQEKEKQQQEQLQQLLLQKKQLQEQQEHKMEQEQEQELLHQKKQLQEQQEQKMDQEQELLFQKKQLQEQQQQKMEQEHEKTDKDR